MVNIVGSRDDPARWKPPTMRNFLTIGELADAVERTTNRIRTLEREGVLPKPVRVKVGRLRVRLYSPQEVRQVKAHFKRAQDGPRKFWR